MCRMFFRYLLKSRKKLFSFLQNYFHTLLQSLINDWIMRILKSRKGGENMRLLKKVLTSTLASVVLLSIASGPVLANGYYDYDHKDYSYYKHDRKNDYKKDRRFIIIIVKKPDYYKSYNKRYDYDHHYKYSRYDKYDKKYSHAGYYYKSSYGGHNYWQY